MISKSYIQVGECGVPAICLASGMRTANVIGHIKDHLVTLPHLLRPMYGKSLTAFDPILLTTLHQQAKSAAAVSVESICHSAVRQAASSSQTIPHKRSIHPYCQLKLISERLLSVCRSRYNSRLFGPKPQNNQVRNPEPKSAIPVPGQEWDFGPYAVLH